MLKLTIGPHKVNLPTSWDELTFKQYVSFLTMKTDAELLAILTGLDADYLGKAVIVGLEDLLTAAAFINSPPNFKVAYDTIGPYKSPVNRKGQFDIRYESLGQYVDMKAIYNKMPGDVTATEKLKWNIEKYPQYIAIYLQKIRDGEYDHAKAMEMADEVSNYPAGEVQQLGGFFFLKLRSLLSGTPKTSPLTNQTPKKSKRVSKASRKSSGSTRRSTGSRGR
jgi:hypothetical protein